MNATSNHTNTHSNSYWKQPLPRVWLLVPNQLSILVVRLLRTHHPVLVIVVLLLILLLLFVVLLFLLHYYSSNSNNNYHLFDLNYDNQYTDHSSSSTSYYGLLGGYDRLGNWMDQHRIQQYHYSTTTNPSYTNNPTILYPLVQLRANLKNRMGYSLYLYEILRRNNYYTSANTSTTMTTTKHSITSSSIESNDYNSYSTYEITNIHSNDDNTTSMNGGSSNMNSKKYSIQHTLDQNTCYIHWRCHRCLHSPYHGTIRQCTFAQNSHDHYLFPDFYYPCPNCLVQSFDSLFPKSTLSANDNQQQQQLQPHRITISSSINYHDNSDNSNDDTNNTSQRNVTSSRKDNGDDMDQQQRNRRRIPYIVHQSWYHDIDSMEYPELSRIQYAWKSMITSSHANYYNNRYNFYRSNEKDEINYIILHFPPLFQEVYNRIGTTSSASHSHHNDIQRRPQQQHNFFRFLVLYREGGIWSNSK